jgi:hypothetical protein
MLQMKKVAAIKKPKPKSNPEPKVDESHPLKLTSLLYLWQALDQEQYEDCPEIVSIAFEFGAHPNEIESVVSDYVKRDRSDFWNLGEI